MHLKTQGQIRIFLAGFLFAFNASANDLCSKAMAALESKGLLNSSITVDPTERPKVILDSLMGHLNSLPARDPYAGYEANLKPLNGQPKMVLKGMQGDYQGRAKASSTMKYEPAEDPEMTVAGILNPTESTLLALGIESAFRKNAHPITPGDKMALSTSTGTGMLYRYQNDPSTSTPAQRRYYQWNEAKGQGVKNKKINLSNPFYQLSEDTIRQFPDYAFSGELVLKAVQEGELAGLCQTHACAMASILNGYGYTDKQVWPAFGKPHGDALNHVYLLFQPKKDGLIVPLEPFANFPLSNNLVDKRIIQEESDPDHLQKMWLRHFPIQAGEDRNYLPVEKTAPKIEIRQATPSF